MAPERDLVTAFMHREMRLAYQPKVSMRDRRFVGAESLVRWKHPRLGLFHLSAFVPFIEESDDYCAMLVDFLLEQAIV